LTSKTTSLSLLPAFKRVFPLLFPLTKTVQFKMHQAAKNIFHFADLHLKHALYRD
jgi:hypothetical protein